MLKCGYPQKRASDNEEKKKKKHNHFKFEYHLNFFLILPFAIMLSTAAIGLLLYQCDVFLSHLGGYAKEQGVLSSSERVISSIKLMMHGGCNAIHLLGSRRRH